MKSRFLEEFHFYKKTLQNYCSVENEKIFRNKEEK